MIKMNLSILPYFIVIFAITKILRNHDTKLTYIIWWLLILKFFIPINIFSFEKQINFSLVEKEFLFRETAEFVGSPISSIPTDQQFTINSYFLIGYLIVFIMILCIFLYKKFSIYSLINKSIKNTTIIQDVLSKIKTNIYLKKTIGIFTIKANFACTTGIFTKHILLPQNILSKSKSEIESIILHESIHIKNNDSLTLDILHFLKIVFWFNPIFYILLQEMRFLQEMICDQQVMDTKMLSKKDYGMAIINFNNINRELILNPNFAKSSKTLFLRIKQLNRRKKMKTRMKFLMIICVLSMLVINIDLSAKSSDEKFIKPIKVGYVSSRFGMRMHPFKMIEMHHDGIDIGAPKGTPVYAVKSGVVIVAEFKKNIGNYIIIQHENSTTVYGQLSEILVNKGDKVFQEKMIGKVGSSGVSTGHHLHFEIRENNEAVNPENYIKF